jgi:5-oxoprolinase (ATP-hydrolysing)
MKLCKKAVCALKILSVRRARQDDDDLAPMTARILANGRIYPAFGMAAGQAGAMGINQALRTDGTTERLRHIVQVTIAERGEIHTPGGGGWGVS